MILIKLIEKDVYILGLAQILAKLSNRTLTDYIAEFNQQEFSALSNTLPFMKDEDSAEKAFGYLVNDIYKRVKKKFPQRSDFNVNDQTVSSKHTSET